MTVPSETNRSGPYNGNGVTTAFDYEFRIVDESYLRAIKADAAGVETVLTLTADYAVTGVRAPEGGQVVLTVALPTGQTLTLLPHVPFTQEIDLENQGAYYAETVETGLDLAVMRDQQLQEQINRAVTIPASEDPAQLDGLVHDILRLADSADEIDTVAGIEDDVTTVAGIAAEVVAAGPAATAAAASAVTAWEWAQKDEDVAVNDGVHAPGFSAFNWMRKALGYAASASASAIAAAASAASINLPPVSADTFLQAKPDASGYLTKTAAQVRDILGSPFINSFARTPAADGVTNDVAALVALEATAEEVIRLKNASYFIGTNYTPTKTLRFSSGTKFLVANGVTVDFNLAEPEIHAPKKQRFYLTGTGAIAGLQKSYAGWFAGDNLNTATNSLTLLQKWADSVTIGGELKATLGYYTTDGSAYIECTKGQQVSSDKGASNAKLVFSGTATRGFRFSSQLYGSVKQVRFERQTPNIAPTVGDCILFDSGSQARGVVDQISTDGCYVGVHAVSGWVTSSRQTSTDTRYSAFFIDGTNEIHLAPGCVFAANSSWITMTGITGTFQSGETVTFSGGSGTIFKDASNNYKGVFTATVPTVSQVLTGSTSGATGTLATKVNGHTNGGIRIYGRCHAGVYDGTEVSGGDYPLLIDALSTSNADRSLFHVFNGCLFDSAMITAAAVFKAVGTKFFGCWFSSFLTATGLYLADAVHTVVEGCQWTYVGGRCILVDTGSKDTQISGGLMADINASNTANLPAIQFVSGTTGKVRDVTIGTNLGYGPNNPTRGVQIDAGANGITLDNIDASLCTTPIVDNGTGTIIRNCAGAKTNNQGAGVVNSAASSAVINHGLGFTPAVTDIRITPTTSLATSTLTGFWVSAATATTFTVTVNAAASANWFFGWEARIKNA
ncbi:hypothetical protein D3227_04870 [Mesorhizobium waimense]|uniref:Uncharacterized protein n=1 Tax=Mesorhizobium waimense TaxID=1300307 RepID=A0A3A5KYU4_9HYPH|nr:hypothetical protein [Mesorhizobium waimense]RJT42013.1 hypothetical protein D3227_04870 [Mesorhizobium waimense]